MNLTAQQMTGILDRIHHYIETRFFNPVADIEGWKEVWLERRSKILQSASGEEFEQRVSSALATLKSSHVAFFHGNGAGVPAPYALNATFLRADDQEPVWLFLDVLEGGVAHKAGIEPGETLLEVSGGRVVPPDFPRFNLGTSTEVLIESRNGERRTVTVAMPQPTDQGRPPLSEVKAVHSRKLSEDIGYVRVAYFPGSAGDRFARAYEQALAALGPCKGLVIDLRGNVGGGLGSLRVMSSLCSDRRPIGFNVSRKVAEQGYRKDRLTCIDRIPMTKLSLLGMFLRFKLLHRDRSIALFTEGLGPRSFHGRIAILVNEHTKSAADCRLRRHPPTGDNRWQPQRRRSAWCRQLPRRRRLSLAHPHRGVDELG